MNGKEGEIVFAFIDSQNLNLGVRTDVRRRNTIIYQGWKLDFHRFRRYLKEKHGVTCCFLFIGFLPEHQQLYESLKVSGYTLIFKPTIKDRNNKIKGNVDAELVLHTMIELPNYDKAIIVSGDGDFHCLLEYLEEINKLGYLFIPNRFVYSSLLKRFHKYMRFVNEMKAKLE